jgi:hypothetical protein
MFSGMIAFLVYFLIILSAMPASLKDLNFLKKLLLYRMKDGVTTIAPLTVTASTLLTSVTTTEISIIISNTNGTLMDEFYNTIFTGNGTLEMSLQSMVKEAVPHLRMLSTNSTNRLSRQRALVELAVKMQPLIAPLAASHPNLTAKVTALGDFLNTNRTGRGSCTSFILFYSN